MQVEYLEPDSVKLVWPLNICQNNISPIRSIFGLKCLIVFEKNKDFNTCGIYLDIVDMPDILQNIEMYVSIKLLNNKKDIRNTFYKNGKEHTTSRSIGFNNFDIPTVYRSVVIVNIKILTYTVDNCIITDKKFHIVSKYIKEAYSTMLLGENIQFSKKSIHIYKKIPTMLPLIRVVIDILDKALFESKIKLGCSIEENNKRVLPIKSRIGYVAHKYNSETINRTVYIYYNDTFWPLTYKIMCYESELGKLYGFMKNIDAIKDINYKDLILQILQSHNNNYDILCKFIKDSIQNLESINSIKNAYNYNIIMINSCISEMKQIEDNIRDIQIMCDEYEIVYDEKIFDTIDYIGDNKDYVYIDAEEFICPITLDYIKDPILLSDGHIYEKDAIELWLQTSDISPKTNTILPNKNMNSVHLLSNAIKKHKFIEL